MLQLELAQIPIVDGAVGVGGANVQRVLQTIGQRAAGTDLIVFPETTLSGFPTRDTIARRGRTDRWAVADRRAQRGARSTGCSGGGSRRA